MPKDSRYSKSGQYTLLSELHQKNQVTREILQVYQGVVNNLLIKEKITTEEGWFIIDFNNTVVDLKLAELSMAKEQSNLPMASTSQRPQDMRIANPDEGRALTIKLNELVVIPAKFEGIRHKARRWLDDFERAAISNSWNNATKAKYFQSYLGGSANDWFAVMVQTNPSETPSWEKISNSFRNYYIGKDDDLALERALKDSVQKQSESCGGFISRYARLLLLSDPNISQARIVNAIRIRLKPEIMDRLANIHVTSLESLNSACSEIEDGIRSQKSIDSQRRDASGGAKDPKRSAKQPYKKNEDKTRPNRKDTSSKITCHRCKRPGHVKADCFALKNVNGEELKDKP